MLYWNAPCNYNIYEIKLCTNNVCKYDDFFRLEQVEKKAPIVLHTILLELGGNCALSMSYVFN